jgi:hypothetical protein
VQNGFLSLAALLRTGIPNVPVQGFALRPPITALHIPVPYIQLLKNHIF